MSTRHLEFFPKMSRKLNKANSKEILLSVNPIEKICLHKMSDISSDFLQGNWNLELMRLQKLFI